MSGYGCRLLHCFSNVALSCHTIAPRSEGGCLDMSLNAHVQA